MRCRCRTTLAAVAGAVLAAALVASVAMIAGLPSAAVAQTADPLSRAIVTLKALPAAQKGPALAAEVSGEGHWTFANPAGERFTAASADEMKRVLPTLAPEAMKPGARLALLLGEDAVFRHRPHLQALALAADRRTDLFVAVDGTSYPLVRRGGDRFLAEIRPSLMLDLTERRLFDEAAWQLAHPLKRASVRVVALEPGGPTTIPATPRLDPGTKRALTDSVAPPSLAGALKALAGQTVILTARRDGDTLAFRPASGPEMTLPVQDVLAAAEAADVNLVLLQSATPRQPGTRSWWWQTVSISRLDSALGRDHLADFLNSLASPGTKMMVSAADKGNGRIALGAVPLKDESSPRTGIGEALSDLVSNIAGQVVVSGVETSLRDRARQAELDRRLVPGVPSLVQWVYLVLIGLGIAGHGVAWGWWGRIWPPETREGYGNAFGWLAARAVRGVAYAAMFMPLVSPASAAVALLAMVGGHVRGKATTGVGAGSKAGAPVLAQDLR